LSIENKNQKIILVRIVDKNDFTDEEEKPEQKQEPVHVGVKRKIKMEAYPTFLAKRHKDFQNFR
jgi:hypothetical protein